MTQTLGHLEIWSLHTTLILFEKEKISGGWKLLADVNGLPVQVSSLVDSTVKGNAHFNSPDQKTAVFNFTYATGASSGKSFNLNNSATPLLSIVEPLVVNLSNHN